jgi:hypothetical protein
MFVLGLCAAPCESFHGFPVLRNREFGLDPAGFGLEMESDYLSVTFDS